MSKKGESSESPAKSALPKARRVAIVAGAVLLGLYVIYLVGGNVLIRTSILQDQLSLSPRTMVVRYRSAYTLWPGIAHVEGVHIRGRDSNIEWQLEIDEATPHISLFDLAHHVFHVTRVNADGLAFRVRQRIRKSNQTPLMLAALPPIDGFPEPPTRGLDSGPVPDDGYDLWTAHLENIAVSHVREIWIDTIRFSGEANAHGSFLFTPVRYLHVEPGEIDVVHGELHVGEDPIVMGMHGKLAGVVHPFDVREPVGLGVFEYFSWNVDLDGDLENVRFLRHFMSEPPPLEGGKGSLHMALSLSHGVFVKGSELKATLEGLTFHEGDLKFAGTAHLSFTVDEERDRRVRGKAGVTASFDMKKKGYEYFPLRVPQSAFLARLPDVDVLHGFPGITFSVDLPNGEIPNAQLLGAFIPRGDFAVTGGKGSVRMHLDFSPEDSLIQGDGALSLASFSGKTGDVELQGKAFADIKIHPSNLDKAGLDLTDSSLEVSDIAVLDPQNPPHWWGRVDLDKTYLRLKGQTTLRTDARVNFRDGRPFLASFRNQYPTWLRGMLTLEGLKGSAHVDVAPGEFDLVGFQAHGGAFDVQGNYRSRGTSKHGVFLVQSGILSVGLEFAGGGPKLVLLGASSWYRGQTAASN